MTSALYPTYPRAALAFKQGEGAWLTAESGDRYLDFSAGVAVLSLAALLVPTPKAWAQG